MLSSFLDYFEELISYHLGSSDGAIESDPRKINMNGENPRNNKMERLLKSGCVLFGVVVVVDAQEQSVCHEKCVFVHKWQTIDHFLLLRILRIHLQVLSGHGIHNPYIFP